MRELQGLNLELPIGEQTAGSKANGDVGLEHSVPVKTESSFAFFRLRVLRPGVVGDRVGTTISRLRATRQARARAQDRLKPEVPR